MQQTVPNLIPMLPEIFILGMICVVLLADLFIKQKKRLVTFFLLEFALVGAFIISAVLFSYPNTRIFHGMFIHDQIGSILNMVIYICSFFTFLYARQYLSDHKIHQGEFYILGLFSVLGMMVLVSAGSLLLIFLGLEILSFPIYAMVAMQKTEKISSEAAVKYYVMGAMASAILLYGMSMLYGATGSLELTTIAENISQIDTVYQIILIFALVFIVAGVAFKLGAAPFHMWAPDVYHGAPTPVTLFITSAPKVAGVAMVVRLLVEALPGLHLEWVHLLIVLSIASMALGNVVAIVQTNIKRMLAYSSIAHMGYMLLGFIAASDYGYAASTFYIIVYAFMSMAAFAVVTVMSRAGFDVETIQDLKGLNTRNPWLAFMMLLVMFSMAGIPPLVGFFAKLGVLEALIRSHYVWLAAIAIIFAVIGAYYYLAIVKVMYFEEPLDESHIHTGWDMRVAITVNSVALVALGLFPTAIIDLCRRAFGM